MNGTKEAVTIPLMLELADLDILLMIRVPNAVIKLVAVLVDVTFIQMHFPKLLVTWLGTIFMKTG